MPSLKDIKNSDFGAKSFAPVDVESFIQSKGIEYTVSGKWLKMRCILPFGHDDSSPSFFIHKEHGGYNCYVDGSGTWTELCTHMNWNVDIDSLDVDSVPDAIWKDSVEKIKGMKQDDIIKKVRSFHKPHGFRKIDSIDRDCTKHIEYLKQRKIENLIDEFEIGYTIQKDYEYGIEYLNRIIIPCHNIDGKYIWSEGRLITSSKTDRKYYRPFGVVKTKYLFNIHRVLQTGHDWVIVVEGIVDAMNLWMWKFPAVCCYGASIAPEQIEQLMLFNKVVLCLDNDKAGIKGFVEAKDLLKGTGVNLFRTLLPKGQDVNNISLAKWNRIFANSKNIS